MYPKCLLFLPWAESSFGIITVFPLVLVKGTERDNGGSSLTKLQAEQSDIAPSSPARKRAGIYLLLESLSSAQNRNEIHTGEDKLAKGGFQDFCRQGLLFHYMT